MFGIILINYVYIIKFYQRKETLWKQEVRQTKSSKGKDQADFTNESYLFSWKLFTKGNMCCQTWELIYKKD